MRTEELKKYPHQASVVLILIIIVLCGALLEVLVQNQKHVLEIILQNIEQRVKENVKPLL
jgi:hypothetical protein